MPCCLIQEKNTKEIECSLARSALQELEEVTLENLRSRLATYSGAVSEAGSGCDGQTDECAANPSTAPNSATNGGGSVGESSSNTGVINSGPVDKPLKPPRRSSTDDAIEEIRVELQQQLERVQARRLRRREEAELVAAKRQREIDRLRLENQAILKAMGGNNSSVVDGSRGDMGNAASSDAESNAASSEGSGCRLQ